MSTFSSDYGLIQDILIAIGLFGGIFLYRKGSTPQKNIQNLTSLTDTYEKRIRALEDEIKSNHKIQLENVAAISDLQGQVKVYKELPLQTLADGIKEVVTISKDNATSNKAILQVLQKTAKINAEDRDMLTNQNKHIATEVDKRMDARE